MPPSSRHQRLQRIALLQRARSRRRPDLVQQRAGPGRGARHAVGKFVGGITLISQQRGFLGAQRQRLGDDGAIVVRFAIVAARHPGLEQFLAQGAVGGGLQEWLDAGARQGDGIRRIQAALLGGGRGSASRSDGGTPATWASVSGST